MRRSSLHDRLHAAVIAFVLCSTSVSIVFAGQAAPGTGDASAQDAAPERASQRSTAESIDAFRSFTDLIAEAAREQERLSATLPSEECIDTVEAAVSAAAPAPSAASAASDRSGGVVVCGAEQAETAL